MSINTKGYWYQDHVKDGSRKCYIAHFPVAGKVILQTWAYSKDELFKKIVSDLNTVEDYLDEDWEEPEGCIGYYAFKDIDLFVGDRRCCCCNGELFCKMETKDFGDSHMKRFYNDHYESSRINIRVIDGKIKAQDPWV